MLKTYVQRNTPLLILSILFLMAGLGVNLLWLRSGFSLALWLLNLSPGLVLLLSWYLSARFFRRRWLWIGSGIVMTFLVTAFVVFSNLINLFFYQATQPVTDVARYAEVRSRYEESAFVSHFPETIPPEASNVRFYYFPGFLQGGMQLQLRLQLPLQQWRDRRAQYAAAASYRFVDGEHRSLENDIPIAAFSTSDEALDFPDTYEILVLDARSQGEPEWNHGYSYGVALNAEMSEIVYWADDW